MTPEASAARWQARSDEIRSAMNAEAARWGGVSLRRWERGVRLIQENYLPVQTDLATNLLKSMELYPDSGVEPCAVDTSCDVIGDSNLDGQFDRFDIVYVLTLGKFGTDEDASWQEGDWNRDGKFDQLDVSFALAEGRYIILLTRQPLIDLNAR